MQLLKKESRWCNGIKHQLAGKVSAAINLHIPLMVRMAVTSDILLTRASYINLPFIVRHLHLCATIFSSAGRKKERYV